MKQKFLIANWKSYLDMRQSRSAARTLRQLSLPRSVAVIVCPSAPALPPVAEILGHSSILLGVQNIGLKEKNINGEHSANDAKKLGCRYAIVGHSDQRSHGETDAMVAKKVNLAERSGLTPILCVGESAKQHRAGRTKQIVELQLLRALRTFRGKQLIIAYEPIWAISVAGKGVACPPGQTFSTAIRLRTFLKKRFPKLRVTLLYGGSVSSKNIVQYVDGKHYPGALVGFASTKPAEFQKMAKAIS